MSLTVPSVNQPCSPWVSHPTSDIRVACRQSCPPLQVWRRQGSTSVLWEPLAFSFLRPRPYLPKETTLLRPMAKEFPLLDSLPQVPHPYTNGLNWGWGFVLAGPASVGEHPLSIGIAPSDTAAASHIWPLRTWRVAIQSAVALWV